MKTVVAHRIVKFIYSNVYYPKLPDRFTVVPSM